MREESVRMSGKNHTDLILGFNHKRLLILILVMENLQTIIHSAAEGMENAGSPIMGEKVPLSYLKFAEKVKELCQIKKREKEAPVLNREEFIEMVQKLDCQKYPIEDDEIEHLTSFLHRTGL